MGMILHLADFETGRTKIALNPEQEIDLLEYIDKVEMEYLPLLFGKELYDLFVVDWDVLLGVPTSPRFIVVYEPFTFQDGMVMIQSKGMKVMLKEIVYYLYVRDVVSRQSTVGLEVVIGENTENVSAIKHDVTSVYNDGIDTFDTIQYYMKKYDSEEYPEYNGILVNFASIY
jgi:hypothetical protein